jgi:hypothetical protein
MAAGRPTKYNPDMLPVLIECGKEGMGLAEMACAIGVTRQTVKEWRATNPEFSCAIKDALAYSQAWWEGEGRKATFGKIEGFSATSYIFQMKNRFREDWHDRTHVELTGADGGPVQTQDVPASQRLAERLAGIERRITGGDSE